LAPPNIEGRNYDLQISYETQSDESDEKITGLFS